MLYRLHREISQQAPSRPRSATSVQNAASNVGHDFSLSGLEYPLLVWRSLLRSHLHLGVAHAGMNMDLKRIRDTAVEDGPSPDAKRRAIHLATLPPSDISEDDRLEDWMKVVEVSANGVHRYAIYSGTSFRSLQVPHLKTNSQIMEPKASSRHT